MTDKKLTDNEIIKAFEVFVGRIGKGLIFAKLDVKIDGTDEFKHIELSFDNIFDLINRQKAEIERLEQQLETLCITLKLAKAEAIKEFAERLKEMYKHNKTSVTSLVTLFDNINNLVKEMVGETE